MCEQLKKFEEMMRKDLETGDRWMAAVWTIDEKGNLKVSTTTSDFPIALFGDVVKLLETHIKTCLGNPDVPPPLPRLNKFPWMTDCFEESCNDVAEKNCDVAGDCIVYEVESDEIVPSSKMVEAMESGCSFCTEEMLPTRVEIGEEEEIG